MDMRNLVFIGLRLRKENPRLRRQQVVQRAADGDVVAIAIQDTSVDVKSLKDYAEPLYIYLFEPWMFNP